MVLRVFRSLVRMLYGPKAFFEFRLLISSSDSIGDVGLMKKRVHCG